LTQLRVLMLKCNAISPEAAARLPGIALYI
jgi:hypothetical protein